MADALNLNAGVALHAAGLVGSPQEGVSRAQHAQRRGAPISAPCSAAAVTMVQTVDVKLDDSLCFGEFRKWVDEYLGAIGRLLL